MSNQDIITTITPAAEIIVEVIGSGPPGPQGIQGIPGDTPQRGIDYFTPEDVAWFLSQVTEDKHFVYAPELPSTVWTVNHQLNKYPSVTIVDSTKQQVFGDVQYTDLNQLIITFNIPYMGVAYIN